MPKEETLQKTEEEIKNQETAAAAEVDKAGDKAKAEAESKGASPEEVKAAVEKARTEEKDKLYGQIQSLKDNFEQLRKMLDDERKEKEDIKKKAADEAEEERKAKLSETERTSEVLRKLEEQLNDERKERQKFRKELDDKEKKDELRRYKEALIKANEDEIIPELVIGTTKEELDEALEVAKARFKEYAEKFEKRAGEKTRKNMPRSTNPDLEALEELELSKDLTAFDEDKYHRDEAYREQIKTELANAYRELSGQR